MINRQTALIVGVGSPHGDDQVGWKVIEHLQTLLDATTHEIVRAQKAKTPIDLLTYLGENGRQDFGSLLVCDACRGTDQAGEISRWTWPSNELNQLRFSGSHDIGLSATLQLGQQLRRLPAVVRIWGIQVQQVQPGMPLSEQLAKVCGQVAREVLDSVFENADCTHRERTEH